MTRSAFNDYVRQMSRKLYGISFRFLQNQEEAEDAVQEVFIKMWRMGEKLDEYKSTDALAITMLKNHCIDQIRKQKVILTEDYTNEERYSEVSPSPYEQLVNKESGSILSHLIDQLPDLYRSILIMRDIDGMSYEEIVGITGQNINTLRVTLSRARSILRDEYKRQFDEKTGSGPITRKVL
jgi:RNA polymerase sigma-70 factor (ECF subfamily)